MTIHTGEQLNHPVQLWKREKFIILTWEVLGQCLDDIKRQMDERNFSPTAIVAISRGGLVLGTFLAYAFGLRDVQVMSIVRNTSDEKWSDRKEPRLQWMAPTTSLEGQTVVLTDDIVGDGGTLTFACDQLKKRRPESFCTAVIVKNENTRFAPDYYTVEVGEWTVFPWERSVDSKNARTEFIRL